MIKNSSLRNESILDNIIQELQIDTKSRLVIGKLVDSVQDLENVDLNNTEDLNFNMNSNEISGFSFEK